MNTTNRRKKTYFQDILLKIMYFDQNMLKICFFESIWGFHNNFEREYTTIYYSKHKNDNRNVFMDIKLTSEHDIMALKNVLCRKLVRGRIWGNKKEIPIVNIIAPSPRR